MSKRRDKAMTYGDLKKALDGLTPEQLAMRVGWTGEDTGGYVFSLWIVEEDHINPSGDGGEPVSEVRKYLIEDGYTPEEAQREIDSEPVVALKGQPLLMVDEPPDAEEMERIRAMYGVATEAKESAK